MPKAPVAVKTIVTTEMAQSVADRYGVRLINVLTGFKFIGEQIGLLEERGEAERYLFGFEESYGYLSGIHARDKDAVNASMLICQMAAYYHEQGKTLIDRLNELYAEYGYFYDKLESFTFEGAAGMQRMSAIMRGLRSREISDIGSIKVVKSSDYLASQEHGEQGIRVISLPKSDVMGYLLEGGSSVVVRPSGTEPKMKIYYSLRCEDEVQAKKLYGAISEDMHHILGVD